MAYYSRRIRIPFRDVVAKMTENLQKQGFGIITTIDLQDTFKQKLHLGFRNYKILSVWNPQFAFKAISLESHMGMILPCNVVIQEHENGEVEVSTIDPLDNIDKTFNTTQLRQLITSAQNSLRSAIDALDHDCPGENCQALPTEPGRPGCIFPILG
jgi:uncharacterized protein (DUF302 family)